MDVLSPEDIKRQKEIDTQIAKWTAKQEAAKETAKWMRPVTGGLWSLSLLSSVLGGPPNLAIWFSAFSILSFIAAAILTFAVVMIEIDRRSRIKPVTVEDRSRYYEDR